MELELDGGDVIVEGNIQITLPDYMTMLPQQELSELKHAQQRNQMIVAAGRKPNTTDIVLVTADNRILVLDAAKHQIPEGVIVPIDWGHSLLVEADGPDFEIASDWAIENAVTTGVELL